MTLTELRAIDIPAAWARLTPERQAAIGEAVLAWALASLAIETEHSQTVLDMANDAHDGVADAVEAALPEIDWSPANGASTHPSSPAGAP